MNNIATAEVSRYANKASMSKYLDLDLKGYKVLINLNQDSGATHNICKVEADGSVGLPEYTVNARGTIKPIL